MKKKRSIFLIGIIFFIILFSIINVVNADETIGIMKVYKLKINLLNLDTSNYTIELIDNISDRIYETQEGNETGEHNFAIATDMDESHLRHYGVNVKLENGDIKSFNSIKVDKLIDVDDDKTDSSYSYEYNLRMKILPNWLVIVLVVIAVVAVLVAGIIALKKHKRRIV